MEYEIRDLPRMDVVNHFGLVTAKDGKMGVSLGKIRLPMLPIQ